MLAPGGTLCLSAMNRQSRLLATASSGAGRPAALRPLHAYDPAALAAELCGGPDSFLEEQIFYGHFLAAGRLVLPRPETAQRMERDAAPGSRDPWARQILLLARRAVR